MANSLLLIHGKGQNIFELCHGVFKSFLITKTTEKPEKSSQKNFGGCAGFVVFVMSE